MTGQAQAEVAALTRKHKDYQRMVAAGLQRFQRECTELGIEVRAARRDTAA